MSLYLLLITGVSVMADVQGVVQRDLVRVCHDLVQGGVVQGGREVAQEAGEALAGVQDVAVCPQHEDEAIDGLQH